ncbi:MAG: SAM-dependent methyltransferase [Bacteroidia bacterium]|jgi:SAM-dependent methyltransferase
MKREFIQFKTRQDRPRFISERFGQALSGRVLDVGCDEAVLREFVGADRYTGIDISDAADIRQNLMENGKLPFADGEWDAVTCTDVLEHLENLHEIFEELVRVSGRHLVISLPNNWNSARRQMQRGYGAVAHYGLPLDKPVDRHRWYFSLLEARDFLVGQAERHGLQVEDLVVLEKPRPAIVRGLRRLRYPNPQRYANLFAHTIVAVMRK